MVASILSVKVTNILPTYVTS